MKVSEKREFVGEFYLPRNPGHKIPGTLKIGLNGEVHLETSGNFRPLPLNQNQWNIPLINGNVADVERVTLLDCCYKSVTYGGPAKTTPIAVRYALCGLDVEYKNKDEIKFDSFRFSVEHLNKWLGFVGVNHTGHPKEGMTIDYVLPKDVQIKLSDGIEIKFTFYAEWNSPHADGIKINQDARIDITSEQPRSLFYWTELVDKINSFLCMALDEVVCIKDVEVPKCGNRGAIQIYYQPFIHAEKSGKWNATRSLCRFFDIEKNFPAILNRWIETYELTRPTYFLYLSCKLDGVRYIENMFLSLVQALENLYEVAFALYGWSESEKEEKLKSKLEKLIFTFEDLIPHDQIAMWNAIIEDVRAVRNYLTHYSKTASKFKEKAENPEIVYSLYKKLEVIIQLHFLKQIGFDNREIENRLKTKAFGLESEFRGPCHGEIKEAK